MGWTESSVFAFATLQMAENNINPSTDSYKIALYASNTMTPDRTVTTAALTEYNGSLSQWVIANEVGTSGTGYSAGGVSLTGTGVSQSAAVVDFTASGSPQWTSATFSTYGALVYDTTVSNEGLCFSWFGGVQTVTNGSFTISYGSGVVATFTST